MGKRLRYVKSKSTFCNTSGLFAYYTKCNVFNKEPELSRILDLLNITEFDKYYIKRGSFKPFKVDMYSIELTKEPPNNWNFFRDPVDYSKIIDSRNTDIVIVITESGFVTLRTKSRFRVRALGLIDVFPLVGAKVHTVKVDKNLVVNESF